MDAIVVEAVKKTNWTWWWSLVIVLMTRIPN